MFEQKWKNHLLACLWVTSILTLFILIMIGVGACGVDTAEPAEPPKPTTQPTKIVALNTEPILFPELMYSAFYDIDASNEFIKSLDVSMLQLSSAIDSNEFTSTAQEDMVGELARIQNIKNKVSDDIEYYKSWENEFYYATKVWQYFMQRGYGEIVTSAILGNMMVETSGGTLAINPDIYDPAGEYYGLCQWALEYHPSIKELPFEYQLEYLEADMVKEFNTFGFCYENNFDYEDFLLMTDLEEAALAFAQVYERCDPDYYDIRKQAAKVAHDYFKLK